MYVSLPLQFPSCGEGKGGGGGPFQKKMFEDMIRSVSCGWITRMYLYVCDIYKINVPWRGWFDGGGGGAVLYRVPKEGGMYMSMYHSSFCE